MRGDRGTRVRGNVSAVRLQTTSVLIATVRFTVTHASLINIVIKLADTEGKVRLTRWWGKGRIKTRTGGRNIK